MHGSSLDWLTPFQSQLSDQVIVLPEVAFGQCIADHLPSVIQISASFVRCMESAIDHHGLIDLDHLALGTDQVSHVIVVVFGLLVDVVLTVGRMLPQMIS